MNRWKQSLKMLLLVVCIGLFFVPLETKAQVLETGTCGTNVNWSLNDEGVLTISGSGAMKDWEEEQDKPWSFWNDSDIKKIVISKGVTHIGNYAFDTCCNLESVSIPNSVISIGEYAFYSCNDLKSVKIPDSVTDIGDAAFSGCKYLKSVTIPNSVTRIGNSAFRNCSRLETVKIGTKVTDIEVRAFLGCEKLKELYIPKSVTYLGWGLPCQTLEKIIFEGTKPQMSNDVFKYLQGTVYYPANNKNWESHIAGYPYQVDGQKVSVTWKWKPYQAAKVTAQPVTQKVKAGETAKFTVKAAGLNKNYQWQYKTDADGKWLNCTAEGNQSATVKVSATTGKSSFYYRCRIKDEIGNTIYTKVVRLYVLGIKNQPVSQSVKEGETAKFVVKATGSNKTYQWQYRINANGSWKNSPLASGKTAALKVPGTASRNGFQYRVKITDSANNVIYSKAATMKIN